MLHRIGLLALLLGVILAVPSVALADSGPESITITAGGLTETIGSIGIGSLTTSSSSQQETYTLPVTISDLTGSGSGWNLQITSTQFTTGGGSPATLPTNASVVQSVTTSCVSAGSCTATTNSVSYPLTIPAASVAPTAVKLANAAALSGMGETALSASVQLTIPANVLAGVYSSTLTLTIASGP